MKNKKVKIPLIVVGILAVLCIAGYQVGKYYVVNYAFDKAVNGAIDMIKNGELDAALDPKGESTATTAEINTDEQVSDTANKAKGDNSSSAPSSDTGNAAKSSEKEKKPASQMSTGEIAVAVANSPDLINKLVSLVSYADKEEVFNIAKSNFTNEEIALYAKKASGGLTSQVKSELMSVARSRLTTAKYSRCLQIFSKYADELRKYIS